MELTISTPWLFTLSVISGILFFHSKISSVRRDRQHLSKWGKGSFVARERREIRGVRVARPSRRDSRTRVVGSRKTIRDRRDRWEHPNLGSAATALAPASPNANGAIVTIASTRSRLCPANAPPHTSALYQIAEARRLGLDYLWSDDVVVANDLDEHLIQDSYGKLNAQVSLSSSSGSWTVALIGKNLTDEKTFTWGNDVPLQNLGFSKTYFRHIDPPRTFELRARYNF